MTELITLTWENAIFPKKSATVSQMSSISPEDMSTFTSLSEFWKYSRKGFVQVSYITALLCQNNEQELKIYAFKNVKIVDKK